VPDGGLTILLTSVHRKKGLIYRQWKALFGNDEADDLFWLAPSRVMNPALPQSVVTRAKEKDPQRAAAEYESVWREDVSDFIPPDVIDQATDFGVIERPPVRGVRYKAFVDAAGGTGRTASQSRSAIAIPTAAPCSIACASADRVSSPRTWSRNT